MDIFNHLHLDKSVRKEVYFRIVQNNAYGILIEAGLYQILQRIIINCISVEKSFYGLFQGVILNQYFKLIAHLLISLIYFR